MTVLEQRIDSLKEALEDDMRQLSRLAADVIHLIEGQGVLPNASVDNMQGRLRSALVLRAKLEEIAPDVLNAMLDRKAAPAPAEVGKNAT